MSNDEASKTRYYLREGLLPTGELRRLYEQDAEFHAQIDLMVNGMHVLVNAFAAEVPGRRAARAAAARAVMHPSGGIKGRRADHLIVDEMIEAQTDPDAFTYGLAREEPT